jgi:hypothetical protein
MLASGCLRVVTPGSFGMRTWLLSWCAGATMRARDCAPLFGTFHTHVLSVVCSGGVAHTHDLLSTTFCRSEAEEFAERMCACGVPSGCIIREPISKNTGEEAAAAVLSAMLAMSLTAVVFRRQLQPYT